MHPLKLALNKSMHVSDDEQGINKLLPYQKYICDYLHIITIYETIVTTGRLH